MKYLCLVHLFCNFIYVQPIFKVPDRVDIKDYFIANTKISNGPHSSNSPKESFFNFELAEQKFTVFIKPTKMPHLYDNISEVVLYSGNVTSKKKFSDYNPDIVNGYISGHQHCSGVSGYLTNGEFYGTLLLKSKTFYAENINRFPEIANFYKENIEYNAIIYDQDYVQQETKDNLLRPARRSYSHNASTITDAGSKMIYQRFIKERHICNLFVLVDNSFLNVIHNDDITSAVAQVMLSVNEVNSVFRSTDFDGDGIPDNIGFIIKYFVVIESEESPYNYLPSHSREPVSPRYYLSHFAQYLILRESCLGILFTAQSFQENVLGVSYSAVSETDVSNEIIGGICQRPFTSYMLSLNAIAVSYVSMQGKRIPQATLDTCLTHELGHAFGCRHDYKSDPGYDPEYLMSSHTLPGTTLKNFQFSPISKKHLVMTVPRKGHCMKQSTDPFCGNGILEKGEECDCGASYMCILADPCCIPNGMYGACRINRAAGYQCHPSQGVCCTTECKYSHLEKIGVDCKLISKRCPCVHEDVECECGTAGRCLRSECQSDECVRINAEECICPTSSNANSCHICCLANPEGPCLSSQNLTQLKLDMGTVTIKQISKFEIRRTLPNQTNFKKFCHGTKCTSIPFKNSKIGDYCIHKGNLGMCTRRGCELEKYLHTRRIGKNTNLIMESVGCISHPHTLLLILLYFVYLSLLINNIKISFALNNFKFYNFVRIILIRFQVIQVCKSKCFRFPVAKYLLLLGCLSSSLENLE